MPPRLTFALLGLPGAGKSTLCRGLSSCLGVPGFILGDALRARAAADPILGESLARGELAPESLAADLVREAGAAAHGQVLVLDGFPRHTEQLPLAAELFDPFVGVLLDVTTEQAAERLSTRRKCPACGWGGIPKSAPPHRCPECGSPDVCRRPEDEPPVLPQRLAEAQQRLQALLDQWTGRPLSRIDARADAGQVLAQAKALVRRLGDGRA